MKNAQSLFDPETHYRIEVQGQIDVEWLKSFDISAEIEVDEAVQVEGISVLDVHTDQAGIVGLVRRLHGLGLAIRQIRIVEG